MTATITERQAKFRANVPDLAKRLEAERLWQASDDACNAFCDACNEAEVDTGSDDEVEANPELKALKAAYDQAHGAWCDLEGYDEPMTDGDYVPTRCALSGLLIHEDDHHLYDSNTDEFVLKSALGVPLSEGGEFESLLAPADSPSSSLPAGADQLSNSAGEVKP